MLPKNVTYTSYADDSYVVIDDPDLDSLVRRAEDCLTTHVASLGGIGMKVNESKTEIVLFGKDPPKVLVNVRGFPVKLKGSIKALGVLIDKELTWREHITSLRKRISSIIGGMRLIRNKLTQEPSTMVVTSQIFSILYYSCPVWLTPALNRKCLKTVENLHFRALCLIICDYRQGLAVMKSQQ